MYVNYILTEDILSIDYAILKIAEAYKIPNTEINRVLMVSGIVKDIDLHMELRQNAWDSLSKTERNKLGRRPNEQLTHNYLMFPDRRKRTCITVVDIENKKYVAYYPMTQQSFIFDNVTALSDYIVSIHLEGRTLSKKAILSRSISATIISSPALPLGVTRDEGGYDIFNIYKNEQHAFSGLTEIVECPPITKMFLEHLIPSDEKRKLFISFLRKKYFHAEYSPLVFIFAGIGGAGKTLLVDSLLRRLFSPDTVVSGSVGDITKRDKGDLANAQWLNIDEAGEGDNMDITSRFIASLKEFTGSPVIYKRNKQKILSLPNATTVILTTNINTRVTNETMEDDRRMCVFLCKERLEDYVYKNKDIISPLIKTNKKRISDIAGFVHKLESETQEFARYLKTYSNITIDSYSSNARYKDKDYAEYMLEIGTPMADMAYMYSSKDIYGIMRKLVSIGISSREFYSIFRGAQRRGENNNINVVLLSRYKNKTDLHSFIHKNKKHFKGDFYSSFGISASKKGHSYEYSFTIEEDEISYELEEFIMEQKRKYKKLEYHRTELNKEKSKLKEK